MITVKLSADRTVYITFRHPTYNISPPGYLESFERQSTRAMVYEKIPAEPRSAGKLLGIGIIKHYYKDPEKPVEWRRKIALARALKGSGLNKTERQTIWSAYHNRKRGPETPTPAASAVAHIIPFQLRVPPDTVEVVTRLVADAKVGEHGAH